MSKIGKKAIMIPPGVDVNIDNLLLTVKGPKGELKKSFPAGLVFKLENGLLMVTVADDNAAIWGLGRALAANMVTGVTEGFQKVLEFSGVGYKAQVKPASQQGGDGGLELNLGFTHPIMVPATPGITFTVEKNTIMIAGADKEAIGQVAAQIRSARPPEPYKGSGIKYRGEVVRRKTGKKAAGTTA